MEMTFKKDMLFHEVEAMQKTQMPKVRLFIIAFFAVAAVAAVVVGICLSQPAAAEQNAVACVRELRASLDNPESLTVHEIQYNPSTETPSSAQDSPESGDIMISYTALDESGAEITGYAVFGNGGYYGDYRPDNPDSAETVARYSILTTWGSDGNVNLDVQKILGILK